MIVDCKDPENANRLLNAYRTGKARFVLKEPKTMKVKATAKRGKKGDRKWSRDTKKDALRAECEDRPEMIHAVQFSLQEDVGDRGTELADSI
eukprot:1543900-Karenia_brevis.AAC.1